MSTLSNGNSPIAGSPATMLQQECDLAYSQSLANSLNEMMNLALLQNQLQHHLDVGNSSSPQQISPANPFAFAQAANSGNINRYPPTSMPDVSSATLASFSGLSSLSSINSAQLLSSSLYVKNLPAEADKLLLYEKFAPYGAILSVKVLNDDSGKCKGVGFINYAEHGSAVKAIQALHATKMQDKVLHVSLQAPRARLGM